MRCSVMTRLRAFENERGCCSGPRQAAAPAPNKLSVGVCVDVCWLRMRRHQCVHHSYSALFGVSCALTLAQNSRVVSLALASRGQKGEVRGGAPWAI